VAFQQLTNLARRQWPEFVNEANAGVLLRIASKALFNAWHTDQNHSKPTLIKNAPCLLQSGDLEPVGFVDDQQRGRIGTNLSKPIVRCRCLRKASFSVLSLLNGLFDEPAVVAQNRRLPGERARLESANYDQSEGEPGEPLCEPGELPCKRGKVSVYVQFLVGLAWLPSTASSPLSHDANH